MTSTMLSGAGMSRLPVNSIIQFVRDAVAYGLTSVVALVCDYAILLSLVALGVHYLVASTLSFSIGMCVSYVLTTRFVFADRRAISREAEAVGFFVVGIAGLVLTQILLYLFVSKAGLAVALAKAPVTVLVFFFNFLCRRNLVFAGSGRE